MRQGADNIYGYAVVDALTYFHPHTLMNPNPLCTLQTLTSVQGGRHLEVEGTVDGVVIQHDYHMNVYGADLILRRVTVDGEYRQQIMAGFIYTGGCASVGFYNSTFIRHIGVRHMPYA